MLSPRDTVDAIVACTGGRPDAIQMDHRQLNSTQYWGIKYLFHIARFDDKILRLLTYTVISQEQSLSGHILTSQ